jgi:hypothetical protein
MLEHFVEVGDATDALTAWARDSAGLTPATRDYRFSFYRDLKPVRLVVIDSRQGRALEPGARRMVGDEEWAWVVEHANVECAHLVLATSVPLVMPGGLHDLERWNERVCDGAWGQRLARLGEKIRRGLDLEDWSAFHWSYRMLMDFIHDIAVQAGDPSRTPPATVTILSGDVHFSFRARARFTREPAGPIAVSRVHQIVNSPIRHVLPPRERRVLRFAVSRAGKVLGRMLRRTVGERLDSTSWLVEDGPFFANHMCLIDLNKREARMVLERAESDLAGQPTLTVAAESML